jgi:predicted dehydrogenase
MEVDALLADPEVDLVLNLTIPAVHFDVTMSALSAGKHVFTEKPLATSAAEGRKLVAEAGGRGLLLGSAPDTFLGAAGRRARGLMDAGAIGRPVSGTAFMFGRGMEHWHPNPQFYYQPGGGPMFDMGPYYLTMLVNLLGPVKSVMAMATKGQEERLITADGPFKNTTFKVGTPTNVLSLLEFQSGATVNFGASWDVFRHSNHPIELHGTEGSLRLPDPDTFGGTLAFRARRRMEEFRKRGRTVWRPELAVQRSRPRQLSHARRCRSRPRTWRGQGAARLRRFGPSCSRDHGSDPGIQRGRERGCDCGRSRTTAAARRR